MCPCCGEALGAHPFADADRGPGDWLCRPCRVSPPYFERAVAHGLYAGTLRELLHLLKYERVLTLAQPLGERITALVAAQPAVPASFVVVPVPLHARKRKERGFNQAELLARAAVRAARKRGLDWMLADALTRTRSTDHQAALSPRERRRNLQKAFAPAANASRLLAGRDCLLVDDIFTTGATARAASRVLREAGARSVWVATAARAQREENLSQSAPPPPMEHDVAIWN